MKLIAKVLLILFLFSCHDNKGQEEGGETPKKVHNKDEGSHQAHGSANEYMHRSSVKDLIKRFESPERDEYQQPQKVLDNLGDIKGQTIIDIGAGSGYFSVKLAARGAKVIAADVNEEFQEFIRKRIREDQLSNIETRKIPFDAPGLSEQEVDKALIVNTYHHIENRKEYFKKVRSGTKPDGELIIIDFFKVETPVGPPVDHKISIDKVINELKMAGYSSFDIDVDLLPYQYIIKGK